MYNLFTLFLSYMINTAVSWLKWIKSTLWTNHGDEEYKTHVKRQI